MTFSEREALYFPLLVAAFVRHALPPQWGPAIAHQESAFIATAHNGTGGDAARGGSWGLCQMSLATARSLGFKGDTKQLQDPAVNAELAATLCAEIVCRLGTGELADVAAAYNSGRPYKKAPLSTRTVYVPRVLAFATTYQMRALETASRLAARESQVFTGDSGGASTRPAAAPPPPPTATLGFPGVAPAAIRGGGSG